MMFIGIYVQVYGEIPSPSNNDASVDHISFLIAIFSVIIILSLATALYFFVIQRKKTKAEIKKSNSLLQIYKEEEDRRVAETQRKLAKDVGVVNPLHLPTSPGEKENKRKSFIDSAKSPVGTELKTSKRNLKTDDTEEDAIYV